MTRSAAAVLLVGVGLTSAGCGTGGNSWELSDVDNRDNNVREDGPAEDPVVEPDALEPAVLVWSCTYSPTYDDDWHNDVVCSNGVAEHRPYLREWDRFVTRAEIMESAREYEIELNSGG